MDADFLRAVVDTLLPGDDVLPRGSEAGVVLSPAAPHAGALRAIAGLSGGAAAFSAATAEQRAAAVRAFAAAEPDSFRSLLMPLLQDYAESEKVSSALGWRSAPPQPQGHRLAAMDDDTRRRLDVVMRRGPIWRRG